MNENTAFDATAIMDMDAQKEEELMNTIKMEPIIETTIIDEDPSLIKKQKRVKVTDCFLIALIVILSALFIMVVFKVR